MTESFYVSAKWDDEAKVYYSETNVPGLNVEAETLAEFLKLAEDLAPRLLKQNRPTKKGISHTSGEPEFAIAYDLPNMSYDDFVSRLQGERRIKGP